MLFEAETLDDLMRQVLTELKKLPFDIEPTRSNNGQNPTSEIIGTSLLLKNPRARISLSETRGKPFSALGELLWYMSEKCDLKFIQYYIKDYQKYNKPNESGMIDGGYGPRLFNFREQYNQVKTVIDLLSSNKYSRRAVIQIFDASDLIEHNDIPCTCTLQFFIRHGKLHMVTYMRSNDAYRGLPHDIFAFTFLQEIIARSLLIDLGYYYHSVGSLHLYKDDIKSVDQYLHEGYQSTKKKFSMPPMPEGDPWEQIKKFMEIEARIRIEQSRSLEGLNNYWADLGRLLIIFSLFTQQKYDDIKEIRDKMIFTNYHIAIDNKLDGYI